MDATGQQEALGANSMLAAGDASSLRFRIVIILAVLVMLNAGALLWAVSAFHNEPTLLGVGLVIYGLGLRHGLDADHIAAIDNVTRKLMRANQQPVAVGFFFAIGHASLLVVATAFVATVATALSGFDGMRAVGGVVSASVSALFLLAIGFMNLAIFWSIYKAYRRLRTGGKVEADDLNATLDNAGFLSRILRPLFSLVTRSWHMLPVGFLFGLGFETATEIAVFGVAAAQAANNLPLWSILVFPVLFTAGMALVDTADGLMMLGAYRWATIKPMRRICYSMTITLTSAAVAILIGAVGIIDLARVTFGFAGGLWDLVAGLKEHMDILGLAVIALFLGAWAVSVLLHRLMRLDDVQAHVEN